MMKYLITYKLWQKDEWRTYIVEKNLPDILDLLKLAINDNLDDFYIQFKTLCPAEKIDKNTARALYLLLTEEQNTSLQKTLDKFYSAEN